MKKEIRKMLHLHMFDGAVGGAAASEGSEGASGSEANAETTVVYGKVEAGAAEGQNGTDTEDAEGEGTNIEPNLDAEFDELVKGKYKEQFGKRMSEGIQNRFKNQSNYQKQLGQWEDATAMLMAKYGLKAGDVEGLKEAIENDEGLYTQAAEADGLTPEQYKHNLRLQMDAERGRTMQEQMRAEREKREAFARWDSEAENLKEAFPNFDLMSELENEAFCDSLNRGNDVRQSFFIAHMDEILSGATGAAKKEATNAVVNNIKSRAARPQENGITTQPAIVRKDDPEKFTDEDLFAVAERARKGEKISF